MNALNISFLIKDNILHCFHDIFVVGPAQLDLYILTDDALPLSARLLYRIIANAKLIVLTLCCMYRLHNICHIVSTYWSFLIYEPLFLLHYIFFVAFSSIR